MVIKCVILDLDNTLLKTFVGRNTISAYNGLTTDPAILARTYCLPIRELPWGIRRPYIKKFLDYLFNNINIVAVWSAGSYGYVHEIVRLIFGKRKDNMFIYTRNDCEVDQNGNLYKPIRKMLENVPGLKYKATLDNTIVIDDLNFTFSQNPDNAIHIPAYEPTFKEIYEGEKDVALLQIIDWIDFYKDTTTDVRALPKNRIFESKIRKCGNLKDYQENICILARDAISVYS